VPAKCTSKAFPGPSYLSFKLLEAIRNSGRLRADVQSHMSITDKQEPVEGSFGPKLPPRQSAPMSSVPLDLSRARRPAFAFNYFRKVFHPLFYEFDLTGIDKAMAALPCNELPIKTLESNGLN